MPAPAPSAVTLPAEISGLMVWLTATAGGLVLFLFLNQRATRFESPVFDGMSSPVRTSSLGMSAPHRPARRTGGEEQMARWLRPSVQAARHADPGRDGPLPDD
jgi:hypothetical protein